MKNGSPDPVGSIATGTYPYFDAKLPGIACVSSSIITLASIHQISHIRSSQLYRMIRSISGTVKRSSICHSGMRDPKCRRSDSHSDLLSLRPLFVDGILLIIRRALSVIEFVIFICPVDRQTCLDPIVQPNTFFFQHHRFYDLLGSFRPMDQDDFFSSSLYRDAECMSFREHLAASLDQDDAARLTVRLCQWVLLLYREALPLILIAEPSVEH